MFAMAPVVT